MRRVEAEVRGKGKYLRMYGIVKSFRAAFLEVCSAAATNKQRVSSQSKAMGVRYVCYTAWQIKLKNRATTELPSALIVGIHDTVK